MSIDLSGDVRGISIQQPWTSAIVFGPKRTENRPRMWAPGTYLIHGSQRWDDNGTWDYNVLTWMAPAVPADYFDFPKGRQAKFPTGSVLAVAEFLPGHPDTGCCTERWGATGAFHLPIGEVVKLPVSVPCKGSLGPWKPPADVLAAVRAQLAEAAA